MHNKKILIAGGVCLFILSMLAGHFLPEKMNQWREEKVQKSFTAPMVPTEIFTPFSRQFNNVMVATEAKFLPEGKFIGPKGETVRFADFKGKPTLVNLWAMWCTPCVVELPALQKFKNYYEGRMNVIGLSIDQSSDIARISDFLEKREIDNFAAYLDQEAEIAPNLSIRGIPTSFLIGSDGQILYIFEGDADWTDETAKSFFDAFLLQNK